MKRIIVALALLSLIVALWTGAWLFVATQISYQIDLAARPVDPEMPSLRCTDFAVNGFPFRFDATCTGATIIQKDVTVTIAQLKATALVYRPTHLIAFAQSPLHISDAFYGTEHDVRFDLANASLRLNGFQLKRLSLRLENLTYFDTLLGDSLLAASPEVEVHLLDIPASHRPEDGLSDLAFYASAKDAQLSTFGITGGQLTAQATITALPDDIRRLATGAPLRQWQTDNGELILEKLAANDPITSIEMTGSAALDANGTINGTIEGSSNQLAERFGDAVSPEYRTLFFGARQPDGSYTQTISIVNGTIFVGVSPQGTLPPLF